MDRSINVVLSGFQANELLLARMRHETSASVSCDLNISVSHVVLAEEEVRLPNGYSISWPQLERIAATEHKCFTIAEEGPREISEFSQTSGWVRSLYATRAAPTMLVSGIPMHRIKNTDPITDTCVKIQSVSPIVGTALDTATGLGYTAIEAAKTADSVTTVELDPSALNIARCNPWSRALFCNDKITQLLGDIAVIASTLPGGAYDRVIHDPPTIQLAGDLYSLQFYRQLFRVLRPQGLLYHYVGDPNSSLGAKTTRGVVQRLKAAGFRQVRPAPEAFGLVAAK